MKTIVKQFENRTYEIEQFDSVLELARINQKRTATEPYKNECLEKEGVTESFNGVKTIGEAYQLLADGWEKGTKELNKAVSEMVKTSFRSKTSFKNEVIGFIPNVPLSIMNVPNSMINIHKEQVKSKVISIVYDRGASCGVSPEEIMEAGKNIVSEIVNLETKGYRVELKIMDSFCRDGFFDMVLVNVKQANQSLNLKKLMFPIVHTSWLRVIGFDWMYKTPFARYMYGLGHPYYVELSDKVADKNDMKKIFGDNTVYINYKMAKRGSDYLEKVLIGKEVDDE